MHCFLQEKINSKKLGDFIFSCKKQCIQSIFMAFDFFWLENSTLNEQILFSWIFIRKTLIRHQVIYDKSIKLNDTENDQKMSLIRGVNGPVSDCHAWEKKNSGTINCACPIEQDTLIHNEKPYLEN